MWRICGVVTAVLLLLKITSIINISLLWVLSPFWISELLWLMWFMIKEILEDIKKKNEKQKRYGRKRTWI